MIKAYLLPTQEDQAKFAVDEKPGNCLTKEFETELEMQSYENGLEAVHGLTEYDIEKETKLELKVSFDNEPAEVLKFDSREEKLAYKEGLEDGDGFESPELIKEDDERFEDLQELMKEPELCAEAGPEM